MCTWGPLGVGSADLVLAATQASANVSIALWKSMVGQQRVAKTHMSGTWCGRRPTDRADGVYDATLHRRLSDWGGGRATVLTAAHRGWARAWRLPLGGGLTTLAPGGGAEDFIFINPAAERSGGRGLIPPIATLWPVIW